MMNTEDSLQSSKGHNPGSLDEKQQQADKPIADSAATAGVNNRDEDAADPELAQQDTSKSFDQDQMALDLGLDDGDLDTDVPETVRGSGFTYDENEDKTDRSLPIEQAESDEVVQLPELGKPNRP